MYMAYLINKMLTFDDDQTFKFDYAIDFVSLDMPVNTKNLGLTQFQLLTFYDRDGYPTPLFYNETTKRYVNLTYA